MSGRRPDRYEADRAATGRRLFIGVPLPSEAASEIEAVVEDVRAMSLPSGARDVRWVRLDGLHLTLRFLGPTPPERIEAATDAVARTARSAPGPFAIELAGAGSFPPGRRPRTLWIGLAEGAEALSDLARSTHTALQEAGWPPEDRPFRPHLTVARSDGVASGALVADRLRGAMAERRISCTIEVIGLFESITGGGPARYVPVALYGLGGTPVGDDAVYHHRAPDLSEVEFRIDS
jgi:RNA 2',3'-cyclic 3'-phosphodiesterase